MNYASENLLFAEVFGPEKGNKFRFAAFYPDKVARKFMSGKIDEIRKTLKTDVATDLQAKKLAKIAAAAIAPEAIEMERRLDDAFRAIPIAQKLRGESAAARQSALDVLESVVKDAESGKAGSSKKK